MNEFALSSLLKRGTKTWHGRGHGGDLESTIDLVLTSENLTDSMVKCVIYGTEHGSDHSTIETVFDVLTPESKQQERLLFKNAPWKEINARITRTLGITRLEGTVQQKTDRLMSVVLEAVHTLTPKAKPSPYAKRWWTTDLTQLRQIYTYQLPHSHWGPEVKQPKWYRPSRGRSTVLCYLTRTENLRLGDRRDVVLAEMPVMHA
jgi:hypothetical protein